MGGWLRSRRARTALAAAAAAVAGCHRAPAEVESTALQLRVEVAPRLVSKSAPPDSARVRVTVSVTNPRWRRAVVRLGGPPYLSGAVPTVETQGIGFAFRVDFADGRPGGPSEETWGQPTFTFGPRQTLRHTFVLNVNAAGGWGIREPGTYQIVASFGRQEAPPVLLTVAP